MLREDIERKLEIELQDIEYSEFDLKQFFFEDDFILLKKLYKIFYKNNRIKPSELFFFTNHIFRTFDNDIYLYIILFLFCNINKIAKKEAFQPHVKPAIKVAMLRIKKMKNFLFKPVNTEISNKLSLIKKKKTFSFKTNLTRPRQDYKVGVVWSLLLSFFTIFICYFYFYKAFVLFSYFFWLLVVFIIFLII